VQAGASRHGIAAHPREFAVTNGRPEWPPVVFEEPGVHHGGTEGTEKIALPVSFGALTSGIAGKRSAVESV
jgi:hypothetical protein